MLILFHSLVLLGPGMLFILLTSRAMASVHLHITTRERVIGAVAACVLPGMYVVQTLLMLLFPGAFARFESITHEMWMPSSGLIAGIVMAAWWWHRTHSLPLGLWNVFALPGSAAIALVFEAATHGRLYIQNEGLARWLSVAVWYVSYTALLGVALMLWVRSARVLLSEGKCVVCRKEVPSGPGTCPACGAERASSAEPRHEQPVHA